MAPIIFQLQKSGWARVSLINTAQHRSLLDNMLGLFALAPDIDLDSMTVNQSLGSLTGALCGKLDRLFDSQPFDAILAAGDTTTVFVASLIAFYHHIPFGHIEAGLRTYNAREPFPEEINRVLTAPLATWHYVPTAAEKNNLQRENINDHKIRVTGNPVIDALYWILANKPAQQPMTMDNIVIVTTHRRENFGENLQHICNAILELTALFPQLNFVLPVHPNPHVQDEIHKQLHGYARIHLLPPLRYDDFVHLMNRALLIMTDSGGIQEEAPALGKPVIVLRNITERPAIIEEGLGVLAGTRTEDIVQASEKILLDENVYQSMVCGKSPYGDGHAAERIVQHLQEYFS